MHTRLSPARSRSSLPLRAVSTALLIVVALLFTATAARAQSGADVGLLKVKLPGVDGYTDSLNADRARVDSILTHSQLSPFAAIGQRVMQPQLPLRVVLSGDTLLLGHPSADPGLPQLEFIWQPEVPVVYVRSPNGGDFQVNRAKIGPTPEPVASRDTVRAEQFWLKVYASEHSARVRAFKPELAEKTYHGLTWFDPDPEYRVMAHVEPAERDTVVMPTSAGLEKTYIRHSRLRFAIDGDPVELTLFAPADDPDAYGFLPFTDATSGDETYGGGRYLDLELPGEGQDELLLDFNQAYNPLCAYVPHYNCPIPPQENNLDLAIEAGEKAYGDH